MPNSSPDFRSLFDLDPQWTYLNSGTHSICARRTIEAVCENIRECERNPTDHLIRAWSRLWQVQKDLAEFLGAKPEDLFLRPNITSAMNAFILAIPIPKGPGEILVSDAEYPAVVNICRMRAEQEGLILRSFALPGRSTAELSHLTEAELTEIVARELKPETRMLVLSHVTTGHGLRLPVQAIARHTRRRGVLFAVDGAHSVGALPLDFATLGDVDFYGGNLHKWALGPKGTGFGWVHPLHQAALVPRDAGWTTFEEALPHSMFAPGHRFAQKHMISASIDFSPFFALSETFAFWRKHKQAIQTRLKELQACVQSEMKRATGWPLLAPQNPDLRGPLLSYELPKALESLGFELMLRLAQEHRLQLGSSRLQGRSILRFSPHIYNTEEEIRRAADIVAAFR